MFAGNIVNNCIFYFSTKTAGNDSVEQHPNVVISWDLPESTQEGEGILGGADGAQLNIAVKGATFKRDRFSAAELQDTINELAAKIGITVKGFNASFVDCIFNNHISPE